jgi:short-subunit dehydrogenase
VITGPTAGIGREYAIQLARDHGLNIVLIGRSIDKLKNLAGEIGKANSRIQLMYAAYVRKKYRQLY